VVNDFSTNSISTSQHFFINYEDFLKDYLKKDEIYDKNKKNKKFFKKYPQYVLPKSIIVFVYKEKTQIESVQNSFKEMTKVKNVIEKLKDRGRTVTKKYSNSVFDVYEIINVANESEINDLIFKI
jgi:hypothetical protein